MQNNIFHFQFEYPNTSSEKFLVLLSSRRGHAEQAALRLLDLVGDDAKLDILYNAPHAQLEGDSRVSLYVDCSPKRSLDQLPEQVRGRVLSGYYSAIIITVEQSRVMSNMQHCDGLAMARERYGNLFEIMSYAPEGRRFVITKDNAMVQMENFSYQRYYRVGDLEISDVMSNLSYSEADFLYKSALIAGSGDGNIIEIGSRYGLSSLVLGEACRQSGRGKVYAFDIELRQEYLDAIKRYNLEDYIVPMEASSMQGLGYWRKFLSKLPVRMVWIDGNHEYDYVLADLEGWAPLLKRNGVLLCHDYYDSPNNSVGVVGAVYDSVCQSGNYTDYQLAGGKMFRARRK